MASMSQLTMAMITLYSGDPKRIQHFMKVYAFAKMIAEEEQIGAKQREVIEAAALVHDIGIHAAEKKYRSAKRTAGHPTIRRNTAPPDRRYSPPASRPRRPVLCRSWADP